MWVSDKEENILKRVELGFAGHLQGKDHSHFKGVRTPQSHGLGLRCHHTYPVPSPVLVQVLHIRSLSGAWLGTVPMNVSIRVCRRPFMKLGPSIIHPDLALLCHKTLTPCQVLARALLEEWLGRPQFSWQGNPPGVLCAPTHYPLPEAHPSPTVLPERASLWVWLHPSLTNCLQPALPPHWGLMGHQESWQEAGWVGSKEVS